MGRKGEIRKHKCELILKRDRWVEYLKTRCQATPSLGYSKSKLDELHSIRFSQDELKASIANTIQNPNETWKEFRRTKYLKTRAYFE